MALRTAHDADPLPWLLENRSPGARYLALRDLVDDARPSEVRAARRAAHQRGPIATILKNMDKSGYWVKPGAGYTQKYRSTVWALIALAQLGASVDADDRIRAACNYLLDHGLAPGGQFASATAGAPSSTVDCLQGNLCWALLELGCDDPRLDIALDWMARTVTGERIAPATDREAPRRYYAYKCGPTFACGVNAGQPCGWGATKVMLALGRVPAERRTAVIKRAIRHGLDYMLSIDPSTAAYPTRDGAKPNRAWWNFGFPVFYVTDLLQLADALASLGLGADPRLASTINIIRGKQDARGRWSLEYDYAGKTWVDFGEKRQPNKWVTLRALRVLKAVEAA